MTKLEKEFEISRSPKDYHKTRHYKKRVKDRTMVEDDVVKKTIAEGEVLKVDSNDGRSSKGVTFRLEEKFLTMEVVAALDGALQTAYEVES
jgi:hypothetical protein